MEDFSDVRNYVSLMTPKQFYDVINEGLDTPIGMNTIYNIIKKKNFPSVKIGGRYYIIGNKISEWIERQSKSSA